MCGGGLKVTQSGSKQNLLENTTRFFSYIKSFRLLMALVDSCHFQ